MRTAVKPKLMRAEAGASTGADIHDLIRNRRVRALRTTATAVIVAGAAFTALLVLMLDDVNDIFSTSAACFAVVMAIAFLIEARGGLRNLIRTDLFILLVLFGLTFLEFLFPQESFAERMSVEGAAMGTIAVLFGFAGIALGRQFVAHSAPTAQQGRSFEFGPRQMMFVFLGVFVLGYFHIFWAVNFDPFEAIRQMQGPRFSQPWSRGRYGGWPALLNEIGALIFLLPPLAGAILAQRQRYSAFSKLFVVSVLLLTLFMGFAGGTRNVFITYVITFVAAYLLIKPRLTWKKALSAGLPAVLLCIFATYQMLQVRTVGIGGVDYEEFSSPIAIDYNLVNISRLTEVFPDKHAYLGLEIPYQALIRPIPRAIWPGKPTGLSLGIEEALGAEGLTLAVSFIGEMYMSGGYIAIIVASILFGALAAKWNRMGNNLNSNIRLIVFASGFFAAGLTMRSFLSAAPTLLPTLALYLYTRRKEKRAQSLQRARALRNQ